MLKLLTWTMFMYAQRDWIGLTKKVIFHKISWDRDHLTFRLLNGLEILPFVAVVSSSVACFVYIYFFIFTYLFVLFCSTLMSVKSESYAVRVRNHFDCSASEAGGKWFDMQKSNLLRQTTWIKQTSSTAKKRFGQEIQFALHLMSIFF